MKISQIPIILAAAFASAAVAQTIETPGPQDIPQSVPDGNSLAGAAKPDILRFLNVRSVGGGSMSPDGGLIAFSAGITGQRQLWTVSSDGGWPRQLTFGEDGITFATFSPRGDWILYGADQGGNERSAFYLLSPDGLTERELLPPSMAFRVPGGFSPNGSRLAYATTSESGATFDIHLIDVDTGEDRLVFEGRMGLYVTSWRPDGGALLITETRGEDANDIHLLDLATGEFSTVFRPEVAASYGSFAWLPDSSGFYMSTDQDREFAALAFFDTATGDMTIVEEPAYDIQSVDLTRDGRYLSWTTNENAASVLYVRDLSTGEMLDLPDLPIGLYGLSFSEDSSTALISVTGPQIPGDIWSWRIGDGTSTRATESATAGLDTQQFIVPEHIEFSARDGVTLRGLLYLPKNVPAGQKTPVLLSVHGGPTAQARPRYNAVHQYLLSRGIAIFDLNFRGSSGYGKTFSRLDNKRLRMGGVYDMGDALDFLAADGRVDAERAAVMGGSYGGFLAFAGVAFLPDRFDASVSIVGVSNWVSALKGASPQLKASDRIEYGDIDDPEDRIYFEQISPITHVDNVRTPLMVIHGANDPRDPVEESDQFVRAIRERNGYVEYLRFPDEGHGIRKLSNRVIAYRRVAAFLEEQLGVNE